MAAPSRMRRSASPRSRQPQTKRTRKLCLADGLQDPGLHKVLNAGLGHDWDGDDALDVVDEHRVGHVGDAACARMSARMRSSAMTAQRPGRRDSRRGWCGKVVADTRTTWASVVVADCMGDGMVFGRRGEGGKDDGRRDSRKDGVGRPTLVGLGHRYVLGVQRVAREQL
ncbi:Os10g0164401 [Oryza sativa Japonica Group]|uniref:Os10g0164401 protein n=1 Tax=Oryza sativa subsp. japonica TaxID=39947 RepID=C7J7A1_ORYSJ|nr:Os10g0164401 [Oryza sativa Japonica Group]|eukprot:NP_001176040.1 Os10g0164401 [Oryza sativa Japonica Group]